MRHVQTRPSPGRKQPTRPALQGTSEWPARSAPSLQSGCSEIPEYLFRLAHAALREGYTAIAAHHLRDAAAYLLAAARLAPDAARQAALRHMAAAVRLAAARACRGAPSTDELSTVCARAELALADCEQRRALLAWLRSDCRRAGCHLDSAIRQLRRAQAWLDHATTASDAAESQASDAQRIADALADGWCVRRDRVSALIFGLEIEIAQMTRTMRSIPSPV